MSKVQGLLQASPHLCPAPSSTQQGCVPWPGEPKAKMLSSEGGERPEQESGLNTQHLSTLLTNVSEAGRLPSTL